MKRRLLILMVTLGVGNRAGVANSDLISSDASVRLRFVYVLA